MKSILFFFLFALVYIYIFWRRSFKASSRRGGGDWTKSSSLSLFFIPPHHIIARSARERGVGRVVYRFIYILIAPANGNWTRHRDTLNASAANQPSLRIIASTQQLHNVFYTSSRRRRSPPSDSFFFLLPHLLSHWKHQISISGWWFQSSPYFIFLCPTTS